MSNFPLDPLVYWLLTFHCLIGGLGAAIAWRKGRNLFLWLILGLVGGTPTFILALLMKPLSSKSKTNFCAIAPQRSEELLTSDFVKFLHSYLCL